MNDEEDAPSRNECGGYYCSPEHGHIDCCSTPAEPVHEIEEDVCSVCGTLFKPLAGLRGAPSGCPECAAKRVEAPVCIYCVGVLGYKRVPDGPDEAGDWTHQYTTTMRSEDRVICRARLLEGKS